MTSMRSRLLLIRLLTITSPHFGQRSLTQSFSILYPTTSLPQFTHRLLMGFQLSCIIHNPSFAVHIIVNNIFLNLDFTRTKHTINFRFVAKSI